MAWARTLVSERRGKQAGDHEITRCHVGGSRPRTTIENPNNGTDKPVTVAGGGKRDTYGISTVNVRFSNLSPHVGHYTCRHFYTCSCHRRRPDR